MDMPKPHAEHAWLQQLVGEWTFESEGMAAPDQPASKYVGTESVRSLGGIWVQCEQRGKTTGAEHTNLMTLGYDPAKQRFVGTFLGSAMTYLWVYDGELDPTGKKLVLGAVGPDFNTEGKMAQYRDTVELVGPDHRLLRSEYLDEDGTWHEFMEMHFRRVK